jgi:hypothetical protein
VASFGVPPDVLHEKLFEEAALMNRMTANKAAFFVAIILVLDMPLFASAEVTHIADSPDQYDEPNLIGVNPYPFNLSPSVLETLYGESNLRRVDDSQDIAFRHTGTAATVKAVARFNNPSLQERLRYFSPDTGLSRVVLEFDRVPPGFQFPVGYDLPTRLDGLIPLADSGPVFEIGLSSLQRSNPVHNTFGQDMMVTFEIVGNAGHPNNQMGNYVVGWEYFPQNDLDYQDVVYEISDAAPLPEPAFGLTAGLAITCLSCVRRRRSSRLTRDP